MAKPDELILLFWNCPECGHEHIEGPTRRCPRCFHWRDQTVDFYEAPDSRPLTIEEVLQYQRPDWKRSGKRLKLLDSSRGDLRK